MKDAARGARGVAAVLIVRATRGLRSTKVLVGPRGGSARWSLLSRGARGNLSPPGLSQIDDEASNMDIHRANQLR
jgi:hypothetical protein